MQACCITFMDNGSFNMGVPYIFIVQCVPIFFDQRNHLKIEKPGPVIYRRFSIPSLDSLSRCYVGWLFNPFRLLIYFDSGPFWNHSIDLTFATITPIIWFNISILWETKNYLHLSHKYGQNLIGKHWSSLLSSIILFSSRNLL